MLIKKLFIDNFKSYSKLEIPFGEKGNYIYGENACGKTTILEAIYYLSLGKTFLKENNQQLVKYGEKECRISLVYEEDKKEHIIQCHIDDKGREFFFDDEKMKKVSSIFSLFLCSQYNPESVYIFKDMPSERRRMIDIALSYSDSRYLYSLGRYKKLLKERNAALVKGYDDDILDVLRNELVNLAYRIVKNRREMIDFINREISNIYSSIFQKEKKCSLIYKTTCPLVDDQSDFIEKMISLFEENKTSENISFSTLLGPHRDNLLFLIDGKDVSISGSQGENRIASLSLNLAIYDFLVEKTKRYPVFLLDDVLSDLDEKRKSTLLSFLNDRMQFIITGVEKIDLDDFAIFKIEDHQIRRE